MDRRYLDEDVQLSNKACPNYYLGPRQCTCPDGRCWYNEQRERRQLGMKAIDPETWP